MIGVTELSTLRNIYSNSPLIRFILFFYSKSDYREKENHIRIIILHSFNGLF